MKKVYLFCSAGMSTSILASKMQEVANSHNLPIKVAAFSHNKLGEIVKSDCPDCILLGPQVEYLYDETVANFGHLNIPISVIDQDDYAVAVYAPAAGLMHSAARLEYQMRQEFENGASRVFASEDLLREDGYGRRTLQDDLFIGLPDDPANVGVTVYSPQLRVEQFLVRKQDILRSCESLIGFKRGILSEVEAAERTATEITSSEGDYNLTIQELQAMWQNGAGQALELCAALGKVYGMPGLSFDAGKDLTMDWGDGVLFDRTRTWNEYMSMVTSGLLRPELALAWYFDLPHADAAQLAKIRKELMPQAAQAAPANNEEKKGETQIGA